MLGNIWERCLDEYHVGDATGKFHDRININLIVNESTPRILRGGAFYLHAALVRSALRYRLAPAYRITSLGFRPSRTYP
jgi:formylglycine-generating enzyme required for sulfatase activity